MTEGRSSAAEANVDAEDRPIDATADDVAESAGTDGHDTGKSESDAPASGSAESGAAAETVPAATLPGEDTKSEDTKAEDTKAEDTKAEDTKAEDTKAEGTKAEGTTAATGKATSDGAPSGDAAASGDDEWAEAEDKAYKKELRKGFAFGAAGGVILGAIVALLLGALVWPGYLLSPGNPDDTATQVVQALSAKDGPAIDNLSCKGPDGKPVSQLSGQVLQYITKVAPAGPATTLIDTEARAPVDLTLSVQGQTQTLPSELVLGESKGDWCLKGLAQRQ